MKKYALLISYDGSAYGGWQIQPNTTTVQELLQKAMETALRVPVHVQGSGRTDAGVHAKAQTAHFSVEEEIEPIQFLKRVNGLLPYDIRVLTIKEVPQEFHACYSTVGKIYHYHVATGITQSPFLRHYSWHVRRPVNMDLLREAAQCFVGTHDFKSFANSAYEGSASRDSVRTIYRVDVIEEEGGFRLEFEGNGFLYKMVRNITGVLIEVATGKRRVEEIPALFAARDRRKLGIAAPAKGLFLIQVKYPALEDLPCSRSEACQVQEKYRDRDKQSWSLTRPLHGSLAKL
ncbi:MAG: tRNA pseudouridine(38-40) synthase TruA [Waddliaceae bacterium]|nr:tRNA pseudouridine(38-40) synthase TruA [Waddliaceae bacterium]